MHKEDILLKYLTEEEKEQLDATEQAAGEIWQQIEQEKSDKKKQKLRDLYGLKLKVAFEIENIAFIRYEEDLAADPDAMLKEALGMIKEAKKEDFDKWAEKDRVIIENANGQEEIKKDPKTFLILYIVPNHTNAAYLIQHTTGNSFYFDEITKAVDEKCNAWGFFEKEQLQAIPNAEITQFLMRVHNNITHSNRGIMQKQSRHEELIYLPNSANSNKMIFSRINRSKNSKLNVKITDIEKFANGNKANFNKLLIRFLQEAARQNFSPVFVLPLQDLVDAGIYSSIQNAWRGCKTFFEQQSSMLISGEVKKGRNVIRAEEGVLFYHIKLDSNCAIISINENINADFLTTYFTDFPQFAYSLKSGAAFNLTWYIFSIARQNTDKIKNGLPFSIRLENIREYLGLPAVENVKNRKYRQYIITPIENAVEEIEEKLASLPDAEKLQFTLMFKGTDTNNINEWLNGTLEITLSGDFAATFSTIAKKKEKAFSEIEKAKYKAIGTAQAKENK